MTITAEDAARAAELAEGAADAAHVLVRDLAGIDELRQADGLMRQVWGAPQSLMPAELLVAVLEAGGQVSGAFDESGTMVGATGAFLGRDHTIGEVHLHSHVTGVLPDRRGGVGYALKLHQRAWSLERGIGEVRWTFDPLVRRNAWFNLGRLGARAIVFATNRYGNREDALNAGSPTHRFLVSWRLDDPRVERALAGSPAAPNVDALRRAGAQVVLDVGDDERPLVDIPEAPRLLARVPEDIERLRLENADRARAWADALATTVGAAMDAGHVVSGLTHDGWYVLVRDETRELA